MSRALPPFLAELGLDDADAALDERALRRAYARRLKLIDIEAEPQRFQQLREALETALRWSAARAAAAAAAPTPDAPDAPDAAPADGEPPSVPSEPAARSGPVPNAAERHADAVFTGLQRDVATFLDRALAEDAVNHALADERLASIDARTYFEWRVARLLAEGWQPGHQHLLVVAIDAFAWDSDHARLANFGQVGALLAAAIRDIGVAQGFTEAQRAAIGPLLERLRAGAPPDAASLADEIAALQFLVQRVPNWLRIVAPVEPVNARFQMWRDRPAPPPPLAPPPMPQPRFLSKRPLSDQSLLVMLLVGMVSALLHYGSSQGGAPRTAPRPQVTATDEAGRRDLEQRQRQVDALLDGIRKPPTSALAEDRSR